MTHLTLEQLLALREPGLEPGDAAHREHLDGCPACRAEADRLDQRIARLRALPTPRPSRRDGFARVRAAYLAERRGRLVRRTGWAGLALAASLALAFALGPLAGPPGEDALAGAELEEMIDRSQNLEAALRAYDPESRILDGRTAGIALRLEDQLGAVDRQLEMLGVLGAGDDEFRMERLRLWRERVGLLDALMDVHLTRATYAGL